MFPFIYRTTEVRDNDNSDFESASVAHAPDMPVDEISNDQRTVGRDDHIDRTNEAGDEGLWGITFLAELRIIRINADDTLRVFCAVPEGDEQIAKEVRGELAACVNGDSAWQREVGKS